MGGMRRYFLATVSAAALSTSAIAADIPARVPVKAPPPVVVAPSWAGFYIGINAGVAWHHAEFTELGDPFGAGAAFPPGTTYWTPKKAGFTGGGQAGYNFQTGNVVYGIEADLNFVSNKASATFPAQFGGTVTTSSKLDWMATVRGRLGVTLSPTLIYVTGGWAVAHFEDTWTISAPTNGARADNVRSGWTVGGGIEHMFARNWTAKIEALYADFGNSTGSLAVFGSTYRSRFEHEVVTVRGGLNYKW
jgi:outer membrane immunogenic protein